VNTTIKKWFSLLIRRSSGQTSAEFATMAVAFFLLLFGIMKMGIVVFRYNSISMAAREAARYAVAHSPTSQNPAGSGTNPTVESIAINEAPFLSAANVAVNYPTDASLPLQKDAQVTITYPYKQQIPFMNPVTLTLTSSSQMLVSQ
jgi:Flp pilus assembly protein TadG